MPVETTIIVAAVIAVFAVFAIVLAWVSSIASGTDQTAGGEEIVGAHMAAKTVRRADVAPSLVNRNDSDALLPQHRHG